VARYTTKVLTDRLPDEVFDYLADLRNFAHWDPGTRRVEQVEGDGPGVGAVYDVTAKSKLRDVTLRYVCQTYQRPTHLVVVATSRVFLAEDRIDVERSSRGTVVTYAADLRLRARPDRPARSLRHGSVGPAPQAPQSRHGGRNAWLPRLSVRLLRGPLTVGDFLLQRAFNEIGDRAAAGLRETLDGRPVDG